MADELSDFVLDKRIVERNIHKGLLSKTQHDSYMKALHDVEANAEIVDLEAADEDTPSTEAEAPAASEGGA